jgi:hypothetical protein
LKTPKSLDLRVLVANKVANKRSYMCKVVVGNSLT